MAAGSGIRIGDAEREATATSLREHFSTGRLSMEEFQERLDAAFAAKTDADLAKLTEDLPQANTYTPPWPPRPASAGVSGLVGAGAGAGGAWGRARDGRGGRRNGVTGARAWLRVSTVLVVLAAITIGISVSSLAFAPRLLLVLLAVFAFVRRIFRWIGGGRRRF